MDKELPAKIWAPILAACALVPIAFFAPHGPALGIICLAGLGFGIYLAVNATGAAQRHWAMGCVLGSVLLGIIIIGTTKQPPAAAEQPQSHPSAERPESATLKSGGNIVWIDYNAMVAADRLIHAGVNTWDPERLVPFVACVREPGTAITVLGLHAIYNYAEIVVNDGSRCAGVVHLNAIETSQ